MHVHQPIDIALRLAAPVLDQQPRELILRSVQPLPCQLHRQRLGATETCPIGQDVACLTIQMGFEDGKFAEERVQRLQRVVGGAEQVFEKVRRNLGVEPEETGLAVIDQVGAAFFDAGEGGAEGGGND